MEEVTNVLENRNSLFVVLHNIIVPTFALGWGQVVPHSGKPFVELGEDTELRCVLVNLLLDLFGDANPVRLSKFVESIRAAALKMENRVHFPGRRTFDLLLQRMTLSVLINLQEFLSSSRR